MLLKRLYYYNNLLFDYIMSDSDKENKLQTVKDSGETDEENETSGEYEYVDISDDPLYQVLSAFFETDNGENLCDILKNLSESVKENTKVMNKLLQKRR